MLNDPLLMDAQKTTDGIELLNEPSPWAGTAGFKSSTEGLHQRGHTTTTTTNNNNNNDDISADQKKSKQLKKLASLGADTNDIDDEWLTLQARTADAEKNRRTGSFSMSSIENPHAPPLAEREKKDDDGDGDGDGAAASNHHEGEVYHPPHHSFSDVEKRMMNQYESLDYDIVNSELAEKELSKRTYWTVKCDWISKWIIFALIGISTGEFVYFQKNDLFLAVSTMKYL